MTIKDENSMVAWDDIKKNKTVTTQRLSAMLVNGKRLAQDEVFALAAYALTNDLNPFNLECYYLPNIGPTPGIAGWRKKAQEQLEYEAREMGENGAHYSVEYEHAKPGEAQFDPEKDIAWKATLRDWISDKRWRTDLFATMQSFKDLGITDDLYKLALSVVGNRPEWTGCGVVRQGESFGGQDKMDRNERAKKRAEKMAIRKRFPRIKLPDPEFADIEAQVVEVEPIPESEPRSNKEILNDLGYADDETNEEKK